MRRRVATTNLILIIASFLSILISNLAWAGGSSQGKVLAIKGEAFFMRAGEAGWGKLEPTTTLKEGDSIRTGPDAEVRLELVGAVKTAELTVKEETEFKFDTFRNEEASKLDNTLLSVGVGHILVKAELLVGDSKFEVKTPTTIVGVRGTTFEVNVPKRKT